MLSILVYIFTSLVSHACSFFFIYAVGIQGACSMKETMYYEWCLEKLYVN
jgi:hypothetical protein